VWWFWTSTAAGTWEVYVQNPTDEGVRTTTYQWGWCWYDESGCRWV